MIRATRCDAPEAVDFAQESAATQKLYGLDNSRTYDRAGNTDKPIAGLIKDLKQRGLLNSKLIVWGGEFGRQPTAEYAQGTGRDRNAYGFTMWMAGGGIKAGARIGETDELGFQVARDKVHVHDLHATMLKLLGFDHTRLTYKYQGRNFRLTDVAGQVVDQLIA